MLRIAKVVPRSGACIDYGGNVGKSSQPKYRPGKQPFSTPLSVPLTRPSAWRCDSPGDGPYDIMRLNFLLERRPLLETGYGDALGSIVGSPQSQIQTREKLTYSYTEVDSHSLVEEHLQTSGLTAKLGADARLGSEHFGSAGFSAALESNLTETFRTTRGFDSVRTRTFDREEEVTVTVEGGQERAVHAVPYRRYELSVRLHHVDYLRVSYEPTFAGLRVRRVKEPSLVSSRDGGVQNYRKSGLLLGRYLFWQQEGDAGRNLIPVSKHEKHHINPQHVEFVLDETNDREFYSLSPFRDTPSLYKISNAAFPLKESQRHENWTEEDLLGLQEWVVRDSSWVWEARRRHRRKSWGLAGPE